VSEPLLYLLILVVALGAIYWLFRSERGAFWRWRRSRGMTDRVRREDALKHIHRYERHGRVPTVDSLAGAVHISTNEAAELISTLEANHLVKVEGETFRLTPSGRDYALHIIRAHRVWERYLADETGFEQEAWHDQAEHVEHSLSPDAVDALAANLGYPTHDPHGDPIPTAAGEMMHHSGQPLTSIPIDIPVRIVHLEDEPEAVYAQLVAEGLSPGVEARLLELSAQRVRFWANGDEHVLAPIVAANISVVPMPETAEEIVRDGERLSNLKIGEKGEVVEILRTSRGSERRRFMDLGILPGTVIEAEMTSPSGDPTAYRIRDALIALREEQASMIRIRRLAEPKNLLNKVTANNSDPG
jgi:DtxR family Mn-dependent transcriptional regulator